MHIGLRVGRLLHARGRQEDHYIGAMDDDL